MRLRVEPAQTGALDPIVAVKTESATAAYDVKVGEDPSVVVPTSVVGDHKRNANIRYRGIRNEK
jgi:hypothetical protein